MNKIKSSRVGLRTDKSALTFIEILVAFMLMAMILLPVFGFLTHSVTEIDHFYAESVAISKAKFIMDTIMFQIPFKWIRANKVNEPYCRFALPEKAASDETANYLKDVMQRMFGSKCKIDSKTYKGDCAFMRKNIRYWVRVKVVDLHGDLPGAITFGMPRPGETMVSYDDMLEMNELTSKDEDGHYNLMKKIVLQIKWSDSKKSDPSKDKRAKSLFLVGFKSDLEG